MRPTLLMSFLLGLLLLSGEASAGKSSYTMSSTTVYNGITYSYSSSSTCPNGTAALRYDRKWWCPVAATSTTGTTSTPTATSSTNTTAVPLTYKAQLSWTIPTTRADGTPLTISELAGYEIYYTNDSGSVSTTIPISGGTAVSATVASLTTGNYYFSISAIDTNGAKSALSAVAAITFP